MIKMRRDDEIYDIEGGWFRARWHFSFDEYRDPENDSFGAMRVFNDDRLIPGAIWPLHRHQDIEGLTYVVEGTFGHSLYVASLEPGTEVKHEIGEGRGVYAYLIEGAGTFDAEDVTTGDAAKVIDQRELKIRARQQSEFVLVDVPMQFEPVGIWRGRI